MMDKFMEDFNKEKPSESSKDFLFNAKILLTKNLMGLHLLLYIH